MNWINKHYPILLQILLLLPMTLVCACSEPPRPKAYPEANPQKQQNQTYSGKKALYINSYHQGLPWSDGIERGIDTILDGAGLAHETVYLDSKRNRSPEYITEATERALAKIKTYEPDVLIVSDDNAFRYIVKDHYKNHDLPVVFSGVNWNIEKHGGPFKNTTGMVEVVLYGQSVRTVLPYARGKRIGFLAENTLSEAFNLENLTDYVGLDISEAQLVNNFEDWQKQYLEMQQRVDILVVGVIGSFVDWNDPTQKQAVIDFVMENTQIPTITEHVWMVEFSLLAYGKIAEEQGEWAAKAALQILDGTPPSDIGVVKNRRGELAINSKLAEKLGILFPAGVIKNARVFH